MSSNLHFDALEFKVLSWKEYQRRYFSCIRVNTGALSKIKSPKMGLSFLSAKMRLNLVWYDGGDWRDGTPKRASVGKANAVIRIPGVKVGNVFVALDGNHRLTNLKPLCVFIDWFEPKKTERVYLTDLFNKFYRNL